MSPIVVDPAAGAAPETDTVEAMVLALLDGVPYLNTYDGYVFDSDESNKTISAPLPYAIVYFTPGDPISPRLGGTSDRRGIEFQVTGVGGTREQASWAARKVEDALKGAVIQVGGRPRKIHRIAGAGYIGRDDTWNRPDGGPLFNDARRYVTRT